jgi:hypothetical protein
MIRHYAAELEPYLGPPPRDPGPAAAIGYHRKILATLRSWPRGFNRDLRRALLKRERKWAPRAAGVDARWNYCGAQPGQLPAHIRASIYPVDPAYHAPVTDDDLTP